MPRSTSHPFLACLFLIWFGLTNALFTGGMVECREGSGDSRIEWLCTKNASGECLKACTQDGDDALAQGDVPHPCDDTPLQGDHQVVKAPPRTADSTPSASHAVAILPVLWADLPQRSWLVSAATEPARPSGVLGHIRTVVLLV